MPDLLLESVGRKLEPDFVTFSAAKDFDRAPDDGDDRTGVDAAHIEPRDAQSPPKSIIKADVEWLRETSGLLAKPRFTTRRSL